MASQPKSKGTKALYPNCAQHITGAGWSFEDAAQKADVSTASLSRIRRREAVLERTIIKLINALNHHHYHPPAHQSLNIKVEMVVVAE